MSLSLVNPLFKPRRYGYLPLRLAVNPSMGARSQPPCRLRSQREVAARPRPPSQPVPGFTLSPLVIVGFRAVAQFFEIGGSRFRSSDSRSNLNNLRDAEGGFPSLASLFALRINWRRVCIFISGFSSSNLDRAPSLSSINLSRQAST